MHTGKPVARQWLLILADGRAVIDWGDQQYQDVATGGFIEIEAAQFGHTALDSDLETLRRNGMIGGFDSQNVYLQALPEKTRTDLG